MERAERVGEAGVAGGVWFGFFLQAEDGIRDATVTGVQTCALPIYGRQLWMDPGEPAVRRRTLRVVLDVVRRYDVDGVHLDDYFYPYPERRPTGSTDFPDDRSWKRYRESGGTLARH